MFSEGAKPGMVSNMVVIDISTLCNLIVEWLLLVSYSEEGDNWDGEGESGSHA